jgi:prepilin signal peptidase PulO-like enzyme (type II secretory pathway)
MEGLFIFLIGLLIGSFLNVVIFRLEKKKSFIFGRSFCFGCNTEIAWYDNIPVISFLVLGAKCRKCKKPISWQYPLVELATAVIFFWIYSSFDLSFKFFALAVFCSFLIVIFVYDLKHYLILDQISIPAMFIALFFNLFLGLGFFNLLLGAIIGSSFFAIQFFVSKGKWVGDGDIRLGFLMGLMLGWKLVLVALFLSYLIGSLVGIALMLNKKKKMSSQVPFGPFLALATFITLIYGVEILNWYLNLVYYRL